jgi:subtilisin family serine protease
MIDNGDYQPNNSALLESVNLTPLMRRTSGSPDVVVGLIDGPVAVTHPQLNVRNIHVLNAKATDSCLQQGSMACMHGTFVAGILAAQRGSIAPAIAPNCTLLVRSIFADFSAESRQTLCASPDELAAAIIDTMNAGAHVLNLSASLEWPSSKDEQIVHRALDHAAQCRVLVVAAAGNNGMVGSSVITRHPWVLPVIGCDYQGRPTIDSNLSGAVGKRGLAAPGVKITSLGVDGKSQTFGGTSAATPFVTAAIALLWSELPSVTAPELKYTITCGHAIRRREIAPPLLNAWATYRTLAGST